MQPTNERSRPPAGSIHQSSPDCSTARVGTQTTKPVHVTQETQETQETQIHKTHTETQRSTLPEWFQAHRHLGWSEYVQRVIQLWRSCLPAATAENADWIKEQAFFAFCRLLHGHEAMAPFLRQPKAALKHLEMALTWTAMGINATEARAMFLACWQKVRCRLGRGPVEQAVDEARALRFVPAVSDSRPDDDGTEQSYAFFISIAGHLQVVMGDRPIALPCRKLAAAMKISANTVSRYARWAVVDRFLVKTAEHAFRSAGKSTAAEYRFDVSRFRGLRRKAQEGTADSFRTASGDGGGGDVFDL